MKSLLRKIHLVVGLILLIIFPLTGAYMRGRMPHLAPDGDRWRFSMRGNHIYILLSGLLHLSLGAYLRLGTWKWAKRLQTVGSALLILSAVVVVAAFFFEPKTEPVRPFTLIAMVTALGGTLLHAGAALWDGSEKKE